MNIEALYVFNSMYKLGITEKEFLEIANEQGHRERTGLSIKYVKKNYAICVSHDEKHKIIIKKIGEFRTKSNLENTRILFKTLIGFGDLPQEIYTLHQIAQYRSSDNEIRYVANNLEELKDRICDRFADEYPKKLGEFWDYYEADNYQDRAERKKEEQEKLIKEQLKALFWLFNEDFNTFELKVARENIARIIKVFSRNNRRVAIFQENQEMNVDTFGGEKRVGITVLLIKTYTPRDERYNYVCPNREVYIPNNEKEIWIDDDLFEKIGKAELEVLKERIERSEFLILTADKYNTLKSSVRLEIMSAKRKEQEEEARENLIRNIKEQFKAGKVIRQGIEFTKTTMRYNGLVFKADELGKYLVENNIIIQNQPQFTDIYEGYMDYILKIDVAYRRYDTDLNMEVGFKGKTNISIGEIKIKLFTNGRNIYVQLKDKLPHRITKSDISNVLKKAIGYGNPQAYDEYLYNTSKVNLRLQGAINNGGLEFLLNIDSSEDNDLTNSSKFKEVEMRLAMSIYRKNGKNYAVIQGKEYRVKDIQALFDLGKKIDSSHINYQGGYLQRSIKLLYRAIDGITPKVIGELITTGKREYRKWVAKVKAEENRKMENSLEFLNNAIRLTQAEKVKSGYIVRGLSGTLYYIDEDCKVWTVKKNGEKYVNDKYLCIIDIGTDKETEYGKNDAIAKRLLALSKDSVVADEIYNRGDRQDNWWLELTQKNDTTNDIRGVVV